MSRASAPAVGLVALVGLTVGLTAAVGAVTAGLVAPVAVDEPVVLSIAVSSADDRVTIGHRGGPALDVRGCAFAVAVNGTPLRHQPPIPFFAATGFRSGPTGAFNSATDGRLAVGTRASFRIAGTNAPGIDHGDAVTVDVECGGRRVAGLDAVAT